MRRQARRVALDIAKVRASGNRVTKADLDRWLVGLSPPARKVRTRDAARSARRTTVAQLDAMCRAVVFARDGNKCRRCGKPAVDWSHVYTRAIHNVRWDLDGSYASCKGCHLWWHKRPMDAAAWWEEQIGSTRMSSLALRANGKRGKPNLEVVQFILEQEAKRLGLTLNRTTN